MVISHLKKKIIYGFFSFVCFFKKIIWLCLGMGHFSSLNRDRTSDLAVEVQSPNH